MKTLLKFIAVGVAGNLSLGVSNTRADLEVSASVGIHATADFTVPLEAHGVWVDVGTYGRCWRPSGVAVSWRPYCAGHWEWTDCGWFWVSDEPWGWACYHYGRWVYDPVNAWIWVPGVEWAPAWVEWRVGGGYIGWSPLGPPGVRIAVGFPGFVFVQSSRFHERVTPSTVIVNNTTIINKTTVINNVRRETRNVGSQSQTVMVNEGPGVATVQKATGKQFKPVPIQEAARQAPPPATLQRGNTQPKTTPGNKATSPETGKPKGKESIAPSPSRPAPSAPEFKSPPRENRERPERSSPRETDKPKPRENAVTPSPDQPASAPEFKSPPREYRERPERPSPPETGRDKPRNDSVSPAPSQPPGSQPARPSEPGKGKSPSKGKGKSPEKEKPGKDES